MNFLERIRLAYAVMNGATQKAAPPQGHVIPVSGGSDMVEAMLGDFTGYARLYQSYVWVHKAINKIADTIAPLPVRVVDGEMKALATQQVSVVFSRPNDAMPPPELWRRWVVHHFLGGEAFFEIVDGSRGGLAELWPRRPDQMWVRPDNAPERQLFPRAAGYAFGPGKVRPDEEDTVDPEHMIHFKFYNPLNEWRGIAPISAVRHGIVIDVLAQAWSKKFLKRGARPDFAVIAPQGLAPSEREDLELSLMEKFAGPDNWHRPIVLEQGITDVKPFSFAPKDIEWLEQRKFSRDEVAGLFGIPDEVMGFGKDTYENMDAAHRWFWRLTLLPLIQYRDESLTYYFREIRPLLKPGESIATDLSKVEALQDDLVTKSQLAKTYWAMGVPFNTLDERLGLGIGAVAGGDVGYLPLSLVPVGSAPPPAPLTQGVTHPLFDIRRGGYIAGSVEYESGLHKSLWDSHERQLLQFEPRMRRKLAEDLSRQQRLIEEAMGELSKSWTTLKGLESAASGDLLNWAAEVADWSVSYLRLFEETTDEFGQRQMATIGTGGVQWDVADPVVAQLIREATFKFAMTVNETTRQAIDAAMIEVLSDAHAQGLSIPETQRLIFDRVSNVYKTRMQDFETERIARTELNRFGNMGNFQAMRQSGVITKKSWLAALDTRTRETHKAAHKGQVNVPLDADFTVGADTMQFPGGGNLAEENVNCRCSFYAVRE